MALITEIKFGIAVSKTDQKQTPTFCIILFKCFKTNKKPILINIQQLSVYDAEFLAFLFGLHLIRHNP